MEITLIIVFVLTALLLNLVIVLQPGKGSGMGALGGGGGGGLGGSGAASVFGARGAVPFLSKLTAWLAAIFMMLSLGLARMSLDKSAVSLKGLKPPVEATTGAGADAEGDKAADEAKPAEGDKAAEGDKPAAEAKPAEAKPADAKPAEATKTGAEAPANEEKKEDGGE